MKRKSRRTLSIEKIKELVIPVLKSHGVKRSGLFGSFVGGEVRKKSDIDILVEIDCQLAGFHWH